MPPDILETLLPRKPRPGDQIPTRQRVHSRQPSETASSKGSAGADFAPSASRVYPPPGRGGDWIASGSSPRAPLELTARYQVSCWRSFVLYLLQDGSDAALALAAGAVAPATDGASWPMSLYALLCGPLIRILSGYAECLAARI